MSKEAIKKVFIIAHKKSKNALLKTLQNESMIHIDDMSDDLEKTGLSVLVKSPEQTEDVELNQKLTRIKSIIDFLLSFEKKESSFIESFVDIKHFKNLPKDKYDKYVKDTFKHLDKLSGICENLSNELHKTRGRRDKLKELKSQILKFSDIDVALDEITDTGKTSSFLSETSLLNLEKNRTELEEDRDFHFETVLEKEKTVFGIVVCSKDCNIEEKLQKYGISRVQLPDIEEFSGTPDEIAGKIDSELNELDKEEKDILKAVKEINSKWKWRLLSTYDYLSSCDDREKAYLSGASTKDAFMLRGWVRESDVPALTSCVEKTTRGASEVIVEEPSEHDDPPVVLKNKKAFRPFETVTTTFGLPKYTEIDPTILTAPFFILFFGMMLSDAGYGIILALLSLVFMKKLKEISHFFLLMFYAGVSTIFFGALIGGWFGGLLPIAPLWFDSLNNPVKFLVISLALGIFHIIFGTLVKLGIAVKERRYADAFFDSFLWIVVLSGVVGIALSGAGAISHVYSLMFKYATVSAVIGLVLTQGRHQKGIIKKFFVGLLSLYSMVGYLSDTLSYARILALGLATGVIAMVINTFGSIIYDALGPLSIIILIPFMTIAHVANVLLNSLGAYIHSSRLQYVEYFSKFFESGGRRFVPFKNEPKYVRVAD